MQQANQNIETEHNIMQTFNVESAAEPDRQCSTRLCLVFLGCIGGLFIQLVIGSLYQWGIINLYVTSYFRLSDPSVTLEANAIAFPAMMICIGLTMRLGLFLCEKTHPLIVLSVNAVLSAGCIFAASYVNSIGAFIALYGILFGLISGLNFMIPIVECNRFYPGKKMYINGVILIGTGLGSVVFGIFSYSFLNPDKLRPNLGYYIGTTELEAVASKVPECLRWLALLYLVIGVLGIVMITPVCIRNQQALVLNESQQPMPAKKDHVNNSNEHIRQLPPIKNPKEQHKSKQSAMINLTQSESREAKDLKQAFCSFVCWYQVLILLLGSCGVFLVNGNYKTYVKQFIDDDEFLTIIGIVGSVGNGCSRFFWNLLFSRTGYKTVMLLNLGIQIAVYAVIRFTVSQPGVYLFLVILVNCCLGGLLVMAPTFAQDVFGQATGSNIYGFYWEVFAVANFVQFAYVVGLNPLISFDGVIYICLGMSVLSAVLVIAGTFEGPWKNSTQNLKYCSHCQ